jgi:uncharacterized cofD-like protein
MYFHYLTLQFLPRYIRVALFAVLGLGCISIGFWKVNHTLLKPFVGEVNGSIPKVLFDYHRRGRGPKIVIIGGGHGQSTVLRGLKRYTSNLTAVVTVADDGGSSGRLRQELGILPPGDFRNCIAALADDELRVTQLFQYRFAGEREIGGHSFGNLFISAMAGITGSFESGLKESSQVLAVQGQVLPSTLEAVVLCADIETQDGKMARICGESEIPKVRGHIVQTLLEPESPKAYPEVLRAILNADLVVIGPGSLYTSIMPNLLVPEITQALQATKANKVYICNVATQIGETEQYSANAHLQAIERQFGKEVISIALINDYIPDVDLPPDVDWVQPDILARKGLQVIRTKLVDEVLGWRHNSNRLAEEIIQIANATNA